MSSPTLKDAAPKVGDPKVLTPPPLPVVKTSSRGKLEEKMTCIYGPPGVGKSTLASQFADGNVFFFNCSGELGDLEVFQTPIGSWEEFRLNAWALKESDHDFQMAAIDNADTLGNYCAEIVRKRLGISHESDAEYGKGWSALREEWQLNLAKLAVAKPGLGLLIVTHSTDVTVKTRSAEYTKSIIRGAKAIRETTMDMCDLVLFVDFAKDDDEKRVIKTKPSPYHDAKERAEVPRLPAEIEWPLGENGYDLIKKLWYGATETAEG